jgi:Family of unknown function (DUF6494)
MRKVRRTPIRRYADSDISALLTPDRAKEAPMENERFNLSLRRFLKEVGISSQQEIERIVREHGLAGKGKLRVKMVLTAEGTDLKHVVNGEIDLG